MIKLRRLGFSEGWLFEFGICGSRREVGVLLGWTAPRVRWAK